MTITIHFFNRISYVTVTSRLVVFTSLYNKQ